MSVSHNEAQHRFELADEGASARLEYVREGMRLRLVHTEVPEALGGRGIGGQLAAAAVAYAAGKGLVVVPECPFVRRWLQQDPAHGGGVIIEWPATDQPASP